LGDSNISETERLASLIGGGALALYGLSRRSLPGLALALLGGGLIYRGATRHCPVYDKLGINTADIDYDAYYENRELVDRHESAVARAERTTVEHGIVVEKSIVVNKPREEIYAFWRQLENLPRFMKHLESVHVLDDGRSHWIATAPLGGHVEWEAEITNEKPNELLAWRSTPNSDVHNTGSVHFADAPGGGTEIKVKFQYAPPGSTVGALFAKIFGEEPSQQVQDDLNRFKELIELGD
jgi:uncharacterized membrane protein